MISPQEAAQNLKEAGRTARQSAELYGYRIASPHLILWGGIWFVGYAATDFTPVYANLFWPVLLLIGLVGGFVIPRLFPAARAPAMARRGWRYVAVFVIACLFIAGTYAVFGPMVDPRRQAAFVPLLTGAIYAALGLWMGARFVVAGVLIAVLAVGGYFFVPEHFMLWEAAVGGGGLILAGLWLRSA